jgi:Concanavalin A-like lectin/glucanases superfamily/IPT/TIG domain
MKTKLLFLLILAWPLWAGAQVPTAGLVAYYSFSETNSGLPINAIINATPTSDRFGNPNSAYAFNGNNQSIDIPHTAALQFGNTFTVSAWVYVVGTPLADNSYSILSKGGSESVFGYYWDINSQGLARLFVSSSATTGNVNTAALTPRDVWVHVLATYQNGGSSILYINGVQASNTPATSAVGTNTLPLTIGAWRGQPANPLRDFFNGRIDDVRLYNVALTDAQVRALHQAEAVPATPAPTLTALNPARANVGATVEVTGQNLLPSPRYTFINAAGQATQAGAANLTAGGARLTVPNLPPGNYTVQAVVNNQTSNALPFRITQPAPEIVGTPIFSQPAGVGTARIATLVRNAARGVIQIKNISSETAFREFPLTQRAGSDSLVFNSNGAIINANEQLGLEFRIIAFNADEVESRTNVLNVRLIINATDNSWAIPYNSFGTGQSNYEIVSVPGEPTSKPVSAVFSGLGAPDPKKWRLFRFNPPGRVNEYTEMRAGDEVTLGQAYWLIVSDRENLTGQGGLRPGAGLSASVATDRPFGIQLQRGYNLIGNPYRFTVLWEGIQALNRDVIGRENLLVPNAAGNFQPADRLRPFRGGFVWSDNGGALRIPVTDLGLPARLEEDGPALTQVREPLGRPHWEARLALRQGKLENRLIGLGMHPRAQELKDSLDVMALPRFGAYLHMGVERPGYFYPSFGHDVVPTAAQNVWDFAVETSEGPGEPAELAWDNQYFGTARQLVLFDPQTQVRVNMALASRYRFTPEPGRPYPLKIYYGDAAFIKENLMPTAASLLHVGPNPVAERASFALALPEAAEVELTVLDVLGRAVTSEQFRCPAGFHQLEWAAPAGDPGLRVYRLRLRYPGGHTEQFTGKLVQR